jgi:hypothetical protein
LEAFPPGPIAIPKYYSKQLLLKDDFIYFFVLVDRLDIMSLQRLLKSTIEMQKKILRLDHCTRSKKVGLVFNKRFFFSYITFGLNLSYAQNSLDRFLTPSISLKFKAEGILFPF